MVYIFHVQVFMYFFWANYDVSYLSNIHQLFIGLGTFSVTFMLAVPISMMIEVPFMNLEKVFLLK